MTLIKDIINQNKRLAKISKIVSDLSTESNIKSYLVGGCVRDLMLNPSADSIDIDIMVEGDGISFAKLLAKKMNVPKVVPFPKFATAKIPYHEYEIEVASARLESYDKSSRNPSAEAGHNRNPGGILQWRLATTEILKESFSGSSPQQKS